MNKNLYPCPRGILLILGTLLAVAAPCGADTSTVEVEGVTIEFDASVCPVESATDLVSKFNRDLTACVRQERMIDFLNSETMLWEVHSLISDYGENSHVDPVDVDAAAHFLKEFQVERESKLDWKLTKISLLSRDDVLASIKKGARYSGISYDADNDELSLNIWIGTPEWKSGFVYVLRSRDDIDNARQTLTGLVGAVDQGLDFRAKFLAAKYVFAVALKAANSRFDFVPAEQKWLHHGYAGYVTYLVMRHYVGQKETKTFFERQYDFGDGPKPTVSRDDLFRWKRDGIEPRVFNYLAGHIFFRLNSSFGHDKMIEFLDFISTNEERVVSGQVDVVGLVEEFFGVTALGLLNGS